MDYIKLGIGSGFLFIAQILVWFQIYAPVKIEWFKDKGSWFPYVAAIPISFMFIKGVEYIVLGTGGDMWPSRIIGFCLGIISFSFLTAHFNNEPITLKTGICILLCVCILAIQMLWKTN
jgi:hypothetical protein